MFNLTMNTKKRIYKFQVHLIFGQMLLNKKQKCVIYLKLGRKVERKKILVEKKMIMMILTYLQKLKKQRKMSLFSIKSIIFQQGLNLLPLISFQIFKSFPLLQSIQVFQLKNQFKKKIFKQAKVSIITNRNNKNMSTSKMKK